MLSNCQCSDEQILLLDISRNRLHFLPNFLTVDFDGTRNIEHTDVLMRQSVHQGRLTSTTAKTKNFELREVNRKPKCDVIKKLLKLLTFDDKC